MILFNYQGSQTSNNILIWSEGEASYSYPKLTNFSKQYKNWSKNKDKLILPNWIIFILIFKFLTKHIIINDF